MIKARMKMANRSIRRALGLLAGGLLLAGGACSGGDKGLRGAPVLLQMFWRALDVSPLVWSAAATDALVSTPVSPTPLEFDLIFDRRLDGDRIEETFTQNGVTFTRPRVDPPVTVTWPQMTPDDPQFFLAIAYNSVPLLGLPMAAESTYVFGRSDVGYPSGTALTFHLDRARLTNGYGEAMDGPDSITVTTTAFAAQIRKPRAAGDATPALIASDYQIPLTFSNRPAEVKSLRAFVALAIDDVDADFRLQVDSKDPTTLYLSPAQSGQTWPAGAHLGVRLMAGLPDRFAVPLDAPVEAAFLVAGGARDGGGDGGADAGGGAQ